MAPLAALLLAAAMPQSGPALDAAALAAFDRHCATLDSSDAMARRIAAAGWAEFAPEAGGDLDKLVSHTLTMAKDLPGFTYKSRSFAPAGDRALIALVTDAGIPGMMSIECRIVALGASQAPDAALISGWAKRDTSTAINQDGFVVWGWAPGLRETHGETSVAFIAKDAGVRAEVPLLGLIVQGTREIKQ